MAMSAGTNERINIPDELVGSGLPRSGRKGENEQRQNRGSGDAGPSELSHGFLMSGGREIA
jgi:hypothetical protein